MIDDDLEPILDELPPEPPTGPKLRRPSRNAGAWATESKLSQRARDALARTKAARAAEGPIE